MRQSEVQDFLLQEKTQRLFTQLYGSEKTSLQYHTQRYSDLACAFEKRFGSAELRLFSSPGRSEIGGNHTDHNLGKVLAASIQLDCIAAVSKTDDNRIQIFDCTYNEDFYVDVCKTERITGEKGSIALVRGIIHGFKEFGYTVGGFKGTFTSDVIAAAGVSSSASFEMMICMILSSLYNNAAISIEQFAAIGQFSEHYYWDKASGLMDQMACAAGGLIKIDFENPTNPVVQKVPFDFAKQHYDVIIVNTGKSHADLSKEYSAIPHEMKSVAKQFNQDVLRGLSFDDISRNLPKIRSLCSDRAILRAFHFIEENDRTDLQVEALKNNDFNEFLRLITLSGNSSWKWLQNVYISENPQEQSVALCLALTEIFIRTYCPAQSSKPGACRIHGGGFAGVIQVFLPSEHTKKYIDSMHTSLGISKTDKDPVYIMAIRPLGVIEITSA